MALSLFDFLELTIDNFFKKFTQFEQKSGSMYKDFTSLRNLIIKFHFRNVFLDH